MAPHISLAHLLLMTLTLTLLSCAAHPPRTSGAPSPQALEAQRFNHAQRLVTLADARLAVERPVQAAMLAKLAWQQQGEDRERLSLPIWQALTRALSEPRFSSVTTLLASHARWSPDGATLAIVGLDGAVSIAEAPAFKPRPLRGRSTASGSLLWSPDGASFAAAHGEQLLRWDLDDLEAEPTPFSTSAPLISAALNADGAPLALTARGELVMLREDAPPRVLATPGAGQARWSPDATAVVLQAPGGALVLWRPQADGTRWLAHTLHSHGGADTSPPSWHPQGERLAVATAQGEVITWEIATLKSQTRRFEVRTAQALAAPSVQWSQDGAQLLVATADAHLHVLSPDTDDTTRTIPIQGQWTSDAKSGRASLTTLDGSRILHTDGAHLDVTGSPVPGAVSVWPPRGRLKGAQRLEPDKRAALALSGDQRWLTLDASTGTVTLMARHPPAARPRDVTLPGDALALSPDAAFVAAGRVEQVNEVLSVPDLTRHKLPVSGAWRGWSPHGERLAVGDAPGLINVLRAPRADDDPQRTTWEVEASLSAPSDCGAHFWLAPGQGRAMCVSSEGALLTWGWEPREQDTQRVAALEGERWPMPAGVLVDAVAWSPRGLTVVAGDGRIFALSQRGVVEIAGFENGFQMIWRGDVLWVKEHTGALWRWSGATPSMELVPLFERIKEGGALGEDSATHDLLTSHGGRWLAAPGPEGAATIQLRDTERPGAAPLHITALRRDRLYDAAWSADERWLAMTGRRGQVRLWELGAGMAFEWRLHEPQEASPWSPHWGAQGRSLSLSRRDADTGRPAMIRRRSMGPELLEAVCEGAQETLDWALWSRSGVWSAAQYEPVCPEAALHPSVGAALAEAALDQTIESVRAHFSDDLWARASEAALEVLRGELSAPRATRPVLRAIQRLEATR